MPNIPFVRDIDSVWKKPKKDSLKNIHSYTQLIPDSLRYGIYVAVGDKLNMLKTNIGFIEQDFQAKEESKRLHDIEWHRKFTFSFACLVLFMIGAPLGSIIRKGGLGAPLIFAIVFFTFFYLFNTLGEKFAKQNVMSPFFGMWLSSFILLPVGIFLTRKGMQDSDLFNKEYYYRTFSKLRVFLGSLKKDKNQST